MFRVNLGGEGEEPGVLNQQAEWVVTDVSWRASRTRRSFRDCIRTGLNFLICPNDHVDLPDGCVDEVVTNNVPLDRVTWQGPAVSSGEIRRILRSGGRWVDNGSVLFRKP